LSTLIALAFAWVGAEGTLKGLNIAGQYVTEEDLGQAALWKV
jgi:hypothetical protein